MKCCTCLLNPKKFLGWLKFRVGFCTIAIFHPPKKPPNAAKTSVRSCRRCGTRKCVTRIRCQECRPMKPENARRSNDQRSPQKRKHLGDRAVSDEAWENGYWKNHFPFTKWWAKGCNKMGVEQGVRVQIFDFCLAMWKWIGIISIGWRYID